MKRILFASMICLAVATTLPEPAQAQGYVPTPVTISKDKVKIGGKIYYSHVVLERQTVFSICKAYGVTKEELYEANPNLEKEGLKKNQILNIPVKEAQKENLKEEQKEIQKEAPKETKVNEDTDFTLYTVKWYDDLESIARKFNTSAEVLMQYNGLETAAVTKKQKIKIPNDPASVVHSPKKAVEEVAETKTEEGREEDKVRFQPIFRHGREIKAGVLLPLNTSNSRFTMNADFYSGVLLAAKDLKDAGTDVEINTYDISNGTIPSSIGENDIIIGPISKEDVESVLVKCPKSTAVVSPLEPKVATLLKDYDNLIQAPAATDFQYDDMISWINSDMNPQDRIILVVEKQSEQSEGVTKVTSALNAAGLSYSIVSYNVTQGRTISGTFTETMTDRGMNRIIIAPAENVVFVNDAVRNLILMAHKKYEITLYSVAKIRSTPNLDIEDLHRLNLHVSSSYTINYDDRRTKDFIYEYRALYDAEPNSFAYMGYDTAYSILSMISRYGNGWNKEIVGKKFEGLQSDFIFEHDGFDTGLENHAIRRTVYNPDFTVTLLR